MSIFEDLYWAIDQKFQVAEYTNRVVAVNDQGRPEVRYIRCKSANLFRSIIDPQTAEGRAFIVAGHNDGGTFRPAVRSLQLVSPTHMFVLPLSPGAERFGATPTIAAILKTVLDSSVFVPTSRQLATSIVRDVRRYV